MDSLARMGAAYIDDLNYSIKDFGGSGDELQRDQIFLHSSDGSTRTPFGEVEARNFMMLVAGDEEGYKTLTVAQQIYEASGFVALQDDRESGVSFAHNAAKMHGILDESRSHQIREEFKDIEGAENLKMEQAGEWRKSAMTGGVSLLVAGGTALFLGPAAGVVAATVVPIVVESGVRRLTRPMAHTRCNIWRIMNTRMIRKPCGRCKRLRKSVNGERGFPSQTTLMLLV